MRSTPPPESRLNSRAAAALVIATGCFCFAASRKARAQAPVPALHAYDSPMAAAVALSAMERAAVVDRVRGALWGNYIADALSMPVHWYYDTRALQKDFGKITDYAPPKKEHPGSIMAVSNTGGHGRGGQGGRIIGDVINHGKHAYWGKSNVHYHQGMVAGENTLNAVCARLVTRGVAAEKGNYGTARFLKDYVEFMTTPGSHNDTYAESFHRDFFANWAAGVPPERCAGKEGHNTPTIGGFVMLPPVVFANMWRGEALMKRAVVEHLRTTHDSDMLAQRAEVFAVLLASLARGAPPREALASAGLAIGLDVPRLAQTASGNDGAVVGRMFSTACYITDSFPSVLYLATAHAGSFEDAVLSNTNLGGENCHRGSALGAIMGAAVGESGIPKRFITGLAASAEIKAEIDAFVDAILPPA